MSRNKWFDPWGPIGSIVFVSERNVTDICIIRWVIYIYRYRFYIRKLLRAPLGANKRGIYAPYPCEEPSVSFLFIHQSREQFKNPGFCDLFMLFYFGISETSNVEPVFGWNLFFSKLSFPRHLLSSYPFVYDILLWIQILRLFSTALLNFLIYFLPWHSLSSESKPSRTSLYFVC